ncbi:hypothetical protein, partial [Elstera litoralis]|uniref:hypothetical protein n=1 Tax=Elstera litoralis TaxID=552518 RepID=UPI001E2862E0
AEKKATASSTTVLTFFARIEAAVGHFDGRLRLLQSQQVRTDRTAQRDIGAISHSIFPFWRLEMDHTAFCDAVVTLPEFDSDSIGKFYPDGRPGGAKFGRKQGAFLTYIWRTRAPYI